MIDRMQRVNALLQERLSALLESDAEELGMISVLAVQTVRDLSAATVYLRPVLDQDPSQLLAKLAQRRGSYRDQLRRSLNLRRIPEIHFTLDQLGEEVDRVEKLLDAIGQAPK